MVAAVAAAARAWDYFLFQEKAISKAVRRAAISAAVAACSSPTTVYEEQSFNASNCDLLDSKHLLYVLLLHIANINVLYQYDRIKSKVFKLT